MPNDVKLGIEINADPTRAVKGLQFTERQLKKLKQGAFEASAGMKRMSSRMNSLGTQSRALTSVMTRLGAVIGISLGAIASVDTIRRGEVLEASLRTVTGSAEAAAVAFQALEEFASNTPFSVEEVTQAFISLKAFGLDPGIDAIKSYGNTASAMGKDLQQMVEAIADAATGEFERLKEFGIKAASQGDKVAFTFQGTTTVVRKSAAEIEKFLKSIGEVEFAGATDERAATLDGALSNLGDSFGSLSRAIGKAGLSDLIQSTAESISNLANAATTMITGRGAKDLPEWAKTTAFSFKFLTLEFEDFADRLGAIGASVSAFFSFGGKARMSAIATERGETRRQIEAELESYAAKLEGIGARIENTDLDPFKKQQAAALGPDPSAQKLTESINKRISALELEAATFGLSKSEVELYTLTLKGASSAQLERASAALESVDSEQAFEAAVRASEQAVKAENLAQHEWIAQQGTAAEEVRRSIDPLRELNQELETLRVLRDGGFINEEEFEKQAAIIEKRKDEALAGVSAISQFTIQAARNMQTTLSDGIFQFWKTGTQNMAEQFKDMIAKLIIEAASARLLQTLFGDFGNTGKAGGLVGEFLGLFAHQGAVVGRSGGTHRPVNPTVFIGAPRLHSGGFPGLESDEVPIIAQRGEEILSRQDPRNAINGARQVDRQEIRVIHSLENGDGERTMREAFESVLADELATI